MSAKGITIQPIAEIQGAPGDSIRALGRDLDGNWYCLELDADGSSRLMSDKVTVELAEQAAIAVMAGDARIITKHATITTMAVFITALFFMARRGLAVTDPFPDSGTAPPAGPQTGDGTRPRVPGAAPPAGGDVPAGGDLFSR